MGEGGERKGGKKGTGRGEAGGKQGLLAQSPGWVKVVLLVSVLVMAGGAALGVAARMGASGDPPAASGSGGELPEGASGFDIIPQGDENGAAEAGGDDAEWMREWSPAIFRLGFSFFVGFAVAYALRTFVKLSLVVVGLFALLLFGLEYGGFLEIHWGQIGEKYESLAGWASGQFESFQTFVTGELPSAAAAVGGLALGFRRG